MLAAHYAAGIRFRVNGREMQPLERETGERAAISVRLGRKRKPSATGYLLRAATPFPEDQQGVAVSTLGKVIKRGWEWLGVAPSDPERVVGLVHLGPAVSEPPAKERLPVGDVFSVLP